MGLSSSKQKTKSKETIAPNPVYAGQINAGAAALKPGFEAAETNNKALLGRVDTGLDYYGDVLGGKYMEGNPYLEGIIDDSNEGISSGVASQFSSAGRYGSGMHADILARRLAANENELRYQNYSDERNYMDRAPGGIAGLSGIASALPQAASSEYAAALAALLGKYATGTGESTSKTKQSLLGQMLAASAQVGSAYAGGG